LSKWDNIRISDDDPAEYLALADENVLRAQWIPLDPDLWTANRFEDFCAARRTLLAGALNDMLGLTAPDGPDEPLGADELPEPEIGAWADEPPED
jgi:hypothetical protein